MDLRAELLKMKALSKGLDNGLRDLAKRATQEAIRAATEATPPVKDDVRGVHTRTGALKQGWAKDSVIEPQLSGDKWITQLNNNMPYASYVNDGHRMDRHFVPGLYVNPYSGELEYDSALRGEVGIMVGTKTQYVPGVFMAEKGEEAYERFIDEQGLLFLEEITK